MATFDSIFIPDSNLDASASINATSSTTEIVIGSNKKFAINASGDVNIKFGQQGMSAAAATNFRIPSGVTAVYDTGRNADRIRLYNAGASAITYYIQFLGD